MGNSLVEKNILHAERFFVSLRDCSVRFRESQKY